ncbi:MAG: hypothetical protein GY937_00930 [bacterium]|nr:hypothetical protein [bacterium]
MVHRPTALSLAFLLLLGATFALAGERTLDSSRTIAAPSADVSRSMNLMRNELDALRARLGALEKANRTRPKQVQVQPRADRGKQPRATSPAFPGATGQLSDAAFRQKVMEVMEVMAPKLQGIDAKLAGLAALPAGLQKLQEHRHGHGHGLRNSKTVLANPDQMVLVPSGPVSMPIYTP